LNGGRQFRATRSASGPSQSTLINERGVPNLAGLVVCWIRLSHKGLDVVRVEEVECGNLLVELVLCAFAVDITWSPERRATAPPPWGGQI
jgi:hypothetical protein